MSKSLLIIKNGSAEVEKSIINIIKQTNYDIDKWKIDTYTSRTLVAMKSSQDCLGYSAIIICGGQQSLAAYGSNYPYLKKLIEYVKFWIKKNINILGICLGAHIIGEACGFKTKSLRSVVVGYNININIGGGDNVLIDKNIIDKKSYLLGCHRDYVDLSDRSKLDLDNGLELNVEAVLNLGDLTIPYLFRFNNAFGVQFHPEADYDLFKQFAGLCPSLKSYEPYFMQNIKEINTVSVYFFQKWFDYINS